MGLEKFNYAIDSNIEKSERVFPDDYKIKDKEKDSYDELFDGEAEITMKDSGIKDAIELSKRLEELHITKTSSEDIERLKELGRQMDIEAELEKEAYNYGSELNEKYSILDKDEYVEEDISPEILELFE